MILAQVIASLSKSGAKVEFYSRTDTALPFFCLITPPDNGRRTPGTDYLGCGSSPTDALKNAVTQMMKRGAA